MIKKIFMMQLIVFHKGCGVWLKHDLVTVLYFNWKWYLKACSQGSYNYIIHSYLLCLYNNNNICQKADHDCLSPC